MDRETSFSTLKAREYRLAKQNMDRFSRQEFGELVASPIGSIHKEHGITGLRARLLFEANYNFIEGSEETRSIMGAFAVSRLAHKESRPYKNDPYFVHPTRVAIRLIRDYDAKKYGYELVTAALLHDGPEDESAKVYSILGGREDTSKMSPAELQSGAFAQITANFGTRTAGLVSEVTKPISDSKKSKIDKIEKNRQYAYGVKQAIDLRFGVFLLKLSDFIENGVGIHHSEDEVKAQNIAVKYLPLYGIFLGAAETYYKQDRLTTQQFALTKDQLIKGHRRASELAATPINLQ